MAERKKDAWLGNKGPFGLYLAMVSIPVLALQGMVYVQIVDQTTGAFPIMKRLKLLGDQVEPTVAVLKSDINASFAGPKPEYYYDLSAYWDFEAQSAGFEHRLITDADLAKGLGNTATVLVLPWVTSLTGQQKQSIRDFLNSGHSVIATGPLGARDEDNEWAGWDFLHELTGLMQIVSVTPEDQTYASFRGSQYYSGTVPAGFLLDLPKHVLTVGIAQTPDIYWSDARWHPMSVDYPSEAALGLHGMYGKGRVVWMGFNERLSGNNKVRPLMDNFVRAAIHWAGRKPLAVAAMWPDNKQAAAVMMGDYGRDLQEAKGAAEVFRQQQIPATLFCQTTNEPYNRIPVDMLRETVELGTTGDNDDSFVPQNLIRQIDRLKRARVELERPNLPQLGFKPPQDAWNPETIMALRTAGYTYFIDPGGNQRTLPELMEFRSGSLWGGRAELARIPAAWSTDIDAVSAYQGPTPWKSDIGDPLVREFELGTYLGGVYTMGFRGDLLGAKENRAALESVVQRMKQAGAPQGGSNGAWFASAMDLTNWWSRREKIHVETRLLHTHRIRVSVTNRGKKEMGEYTIDLHLPFRPHKVRILSELLGRTPPKYEILAGEEAIRLKFTKIKRESSHVFLVILDES